MSPRISVLLVDDHALVRRAFRRILEDDPRINIVGEAANGADALGMVRDFSPRVVVMDCAMPQMNGFQATKEILKLRPKTAVLMLSMHSEEASVRQAIQAGARGYILKNAADVDLPSAIKKIASGEAVFDSQWSPDSSPSPGRDGKLSARQLEILQLIVEGKSSREIADELGLSENTVGAHRTNIMRELRIHKTAELVVHAIRHRLIKIP